MASASFGPGLRRTSSARAESELTATQQEQENIEMRQASKIIRSSTFVLINQLMSRMRAEVVVLTEMNAVMPFCKQQGKQRRKQEIASSFMQFVANLFPNI